MAAKRETTTRSLEIENAEPRSVGSHPVGGSLFDTVMQQTAAAFDEQELARTVDLPRLREVARRHKSDSLTLDPIVVELIEAVLETHLPPSMQSSGMKSKIARAVAQPLFDNPTSRGRLELLWSQLMGDLS